MLVKYMNDKRGKRRGVIVCSGPRDYINRDDKFLIGMAFCRPAETFRKKLGIDIAHGRAEMGTHPKTIPAEMVATACLEWDRMVDRARKYFQPSL